MNYKDNSVEFQYQYLTEAQTNYLFPYELLHCNLKRLQFSAT